MFYFICDPIEQAVKERRTTILHWSYSEEIACTLANQQARCMQCRLTWVHRPQEAHVSDESTQSRLPFIYQPSRELTCNESNGRPGRKIPATKASKMRLVSSYAGHPDLPAPSGAGHASASADVPRCLQRRAQNRRCCRRTAGRPWRLRLPHPQRGADCLPTVGGLFSGSSQPEHRT